MDPAPNTLSDTMADTRLVPNDAPSNPWQQAEESSTRRPTLRTPDPSTLDPAARESIQGNEAEKLDDGSEEGRTNEKVDSEVLHAFDPLASPEEKAAQEAWADAEGHPPRLPPKPSTTPSHSPSSSAQLSDPPDPRPSTPLSFPSFASFARSFRTLPNVNINSLVAGTGKGKSHSRPQSLDYATLMQTPTPQVAGSFAVQQDTKPRSNLVPDDVDAEVNARGSPKQPHSAPVSGTASPRSHVIVRENDGSRPSSAGTSRDRTKEVGDPPFDFQKFLDQMKTRGAEPIAKYLRSFLSNFQKRTFTVADQVKLINDFLSFISQKMRDVEPWKHVTDAEFDNAMEGMEKLVMNRLYDSTFTPQVARAVPPRPITTDDLERDRVLAQRIALFGWIEPGHLDVPIAKGSNGFLMFAEQELIKINHYKAPRDKLICILNCCKVIFGLIRHLNTEESADTFIPILIFVVLKANPEHLLSNVEFINRFRNPAKLQSEAGYYLSSLMGAVSFIETMDHTSLSNITQEEFENNVEAAIQTLPTSRPQSPPISASSSSSSSLSGPLATPQHGLHPADPIPIPHPPPTPSTHTGDEAATPLALPSIDAKRLLQRTGDSLSKPLNAIGRIFSEALDGAEDMITSNFPHTPNNSISNMTSPSGSGSAPWVPPPAVQTPYKPRVRRTGTPSHSPAGSYTDETPSRPGPRTTSLSAPLAPSNPSSRAPTPSVDTIDIAGMQAEIDRAHARAADAALGTLFQIFPGVDREVVEWVLEANGGDLGRSIEGLLEVSGGG